MNIDPYPFKNNCGSRQPPESDKTTKNIKKNTKKQKHLYSCTLLTNGQYADHLIGSPLALASADFAAKAWTKFADLPAMRAPGISWTHGSVTQVDCENKTATIVDSITGKKSEESYDYLVASTGLRRAWPVVPQSLTRETYLAEAGTHIESVKNAKEGVVVIGGGMYTSNPRVHENIILTRMCCI